MVSISVYQYNVQECVYIPESSMEKISSYLASDKVCWINVIGTNDLPFLHKLSALFNIHPLAIEDINHTYQRAKMEDYGDFLFVVLPMFAVVDGQIDDQQVSFVLRDNFLLSFREKDYGFFKRSVGDKIVSGSGNIRKKGEDFLLYSLLDTIIDNYYTSLQHVAQKIELLEKHILTRPADEHILSLRSLKSDVLYMRKCMLPARDLISNLMRNNVDYFETENTYFLRDLQDHMTRNIEELDFLRDQLTSLMDMYYSLQTHKMNVVMKTLTGVSFVLLPLTFIASLYGMNFKYMPGLDDKNGFWEVVAAMAVIASVLTAFAFRRNWLSSKDFNKDR